MAENTNKQPKPSAPLNYEDVISENNKPPPYISNAIPQSQTLPEEHLINIIICCPCITLIKCIECLFCCDTSNVSDSNSRENEHHRRQNMSSSLTNDAMLWSASHGGRSHNSWLSENNGGGGDNYGGNENSGGGNDCDTGGNSGGGYDSGGGCDSGGGGCGGGTD